MFSATPVYEVDGEVTFGLMRDSVVPDASDQVYTVTQVGERRMDLISKLFYGTPHLWWAIAMVNDIQDPFAGTKFGTKLRIPTKARLANLGILNGI